jgi:hypothetical protein
MPMIQRSLVVPMVLSIVALVAACDDGARGPRRGPLPELVSIERGTTIYGFFTSSERLPVEVEAFRIAKRPTTAEQYKQCVEAGACTAPAEDACIVRDEGGALGAPTYEIKGAEKLPATCVGITQAQAYCSWVGGALPTVTQWLTAARGREVTRFAWGNRLPRCDHRPDVGQAPRGAPCRNPQGSSFAVGDHAAGAAPFGVEDVLLAPGELIAPSADSPLSACASPFAACVAYGARPGAIDSAAPLDGIGTEHGERSPHPYAFRCAFPGDSK